MAKDRIQRREVGENADLEDLLDPKVHDRSAGAVHQEAGRLGQEGRMLAEVHLEDPGVPLEAAVVAAAAMNQRELGVILRSYERWTLKLGAGCLRQMLA